MSVNEYMATISAEAEKRIAMHKNYYLQEFSSADPLRREALVRAYQEFSSAVPAPAPAAAIHTAAPAVGAIPSDIKAQIRALMDRLPAAEKVEMFQGYAEGLAICESLGMGSGFSDVQKKVADATVDAAFQKAVDTIVADKLRAKNEARKKRWA
ncbi:hypothetical protein FACS189493_1380 [Spirochaetia bacterium]|nr:hypothetical protein FACS189493_1380 [Spirochaetia bacterium]